MTFSLTIDILNQGDGNDRDFEENSRVFLEELKEVNGLLVAPPTETREGSRGVIELLDGIIVSGTSIGTFAAIYTLAKDLRDRYVNAEVTLTFPDGSELKLSNLLPAEAREILANHLEKYGQVEDVTQNGQ